MARSRSTLEQQMVEICNSWNERPKPSTPEWERGFESRIIEIGKGLAVSALDDMKARPDSRRQEPQ